MENESTDVTSDELDADAAASAQSFTPQSWEMTVSESKFYWYDLLTAIPAPPDFRDPLGRYLRRMQFAVEATQEKRLMYMLVSRPKLRFDTTRSTSWGFFGLKLTIPLLVGAEQKRDVIVIDLNVPDDATLKKPSVQVFERFITLNWGSLIETYSVHDLLQNFTTKHNYPTKVHFIGQTRDPAGRLLKGRITGVNRVCEENEPDDDNFLLIQRFDIGMGTAPSMHLASEAERDLMLKDQMDLLECLLIKYFESDNVRVRSGREMKQRDERIATLQEAHMLERLSVDLKLEVPDAFQNLFSARAPVSDHHAFEATFRAGVPVLRLTGKP